MAAAEVAASVTACDKYMKKMITVCGRKRETTYSQVIRACMCKVFLSGRILFGIFLGCFLFSSSFQQFTLRYYCDKPFR